MKVKKSMRRSESCIPDNRKEAREEKFRASPKDPRPKIEENTNKARTQRKQTMFQEFHKLRNKKNEEEKAKKTKVKDLIDQSLLNDIESKQNSMKEVREGYMKEWKDKEMDLKNLNKNTALITITLLNHLHNILINKELEPKEVIL